LKDVFLESRKEFEEHFQQLDDDAPDRAVLDEANKLAKQVAIMGIIVSGLIYSLLNFQNSVVLFIIDAIYGMVFAWSYMYTQTLLMPIYLAVVSGVLTVIMI